MRSALAIVVGFWFACQGSIQAQNSAAKMLALNTPAKENHFSISADMKTLYFSATRLKGFGGYDIWIATWEETIKDWDKVGNVGSAINTFYDDWAPCISIDGQWLYFVSSRPGGYGGYDIWVSKRDSASGSWLPAQNAGPSINSEADETNPYLSSDGLELFFSDYRGGTCRPNGIGNSDIQVVRRKSTHDSWIPAENLGPAVNSVDDDFNPTLSNDGRILFFASTRVGGLGNYDIWYSMRDSINGKWTAAKHLGIKVNSKWLESQLTISSDSSFAILSANWPIGAGSYDGYLLKIDDISKFLREK